MKIHSTVSRRDFMKALGVGAAGVGTAAVVAPMFSDMDDMMSKGEEYKGKRAWYVREREFENPTVEVDWDSISGHENNYIMNSGNGYAYAFGDYRNEVARLYAANEKEAIEADYPGWSTRDFAMAQVGNPDNRATTNLFPWTAEISQPTYAVNPNLSKYQGSPEENSKMMRAALTYFGASGIGFLELKGNTKKAVHVRYAEGQPIIWDDVDAPIERDGTYVIPTSRDLYLISISLQFSKELFRHEYGKYGAGQLRNLVNNDRYRRWGLIYKTTIHFLHYLGYWGFGFPGAYRGIMTSNADAMLTGLTESGRNPGMAISPEHGVCQGHFHVVTDLPLAPTPPIDAGIFRFCATCGKCAEVCTGDAIAKKGVETTWEHMDVNFYKYHIDKSKPFKACMPGKKNYPMDVTACRFVDQSGGKCSNCMGACTFNTNDRVGIHDFVKATVANTSLFNGFFAMADDAYGFGLVADAKKEEWWDKLYPIHGIDSTVVAKDGGYNKKNQ